VRKKKKRGQPSIPTKEAALDSNSSKQRPPTSYQQDPSNNDDVITTTSLTPTANISLCSNCFSAISTWNAAYAPSAQVSLQPFP